MTGQISGSMLITDAATPAVITLVNVTGALVAFATTSVQANIAILEGAI